MPNFYVATAEQVVAAAEACIVNRAPTDDTFVSVFADIPAHQARTALLFATDLGLLSDTGVNNTFTANGPLSRLLAIHNDRQRAATLRIAMETYNPFVIFRERLNATGDVNIAARQTKLALALNNAHHDEIRDTLVSVGTYSQALRAVGGGRYEATDISLAYQLEQLANGCAELVAAENLVWKHVGTNDDTRLSRGNVVQLLAEALVSATSNDPRGAVVRAGNAIESHLTTLAARWHPPVPTAIGINGKLDEFKKANAFPSKLVFMGKYLGHIRNAADHGIDVEVGSPWSIRPNTGLEYVFVACSFINATLIRESNGAPEL